MGDVAIVENCRMNFRYQPRAPINQFACAKGRVSLTDRVTDIVFHRYCVILIDSVSSSKSNGRRNDIIEVYWTKWSIC